MTVLAIDITTAQGSLALLRNNVLLEESLITAPNGYGESIFAAIDNLLKRHSLTIAEIDLFASAAGPGTFTGVRMGLTIAQGLAEALNKPVCGVSNLAALASLGEGPLRAPVLDARRGEYYTALYSESGDLLETERLQSLDRFPHEPLRQTGPLAHAIARLAVNTPHRDPASLEANYIRRTDAELNLMPQR